MIWIIGGTGQSVAIARKLHARGNRLVVTTATEYGKKLVPREINTFTGSLNFRQMNRFVDEQKIKLILDVSHPYAAEVSRNAIETAGKKDVPYIRYEREELDYPKEVKTFKTYHDIYEYLLPLEGNVLITTGSSNLHHFTGLDQRRLFIRLLPVVRSIEKAAALGFLPRQLIALQGPFSREMNRAVIKEYDIRFLVTKQSGDEGGESEKIQATLQAGIEILALIRPEIKYPRKVYNLEELFVFIETLGL